MSDDRFRVLFVCTGNICRSPVAERVLRHHLDELLGADADRFDVRSAGTWGHEGAPMEDYAAACLRELGIRPDGFVARELQPEMVAATDLVLGATREHRAAAVAMCPEAASRSFTLREFGRLLGPVQPADLPADPLERARAVVRAATANRGRLARVGQREDDLADPYGAPLRVFHQMAAVVAESLARPIALFAARQG